jgi:hypothetical protein
MPVPNEPRKPENRNPDGAGWGPSLDALVERGFRDATDLEGSAACDEHAQKLLGLFRLLDAAAVPAENLSAHRETLVDLTLARVMRESERASAEPHLCASDDEALRSLVMAGFDPEAVPSKLAERARVHRRLADLVVAGKVSDAELKDRLIDETMQHVEEYAHRSIPFERPVRFSTGRLMDLVSVAAMLLVGVGVLWPALSAAREQSRRYACEGNFGRTAASMAVYAGANNDELPMVTAGLGLPSFSGLGSPSVGRDSGRWWEVGNRQGTSNSANLYTLARAGYSDLNALACPGNPNAARGTPGYDDVDWANIQQVSYSYQIMFGPKRPHWNDSSRVAVLADRSPVILRAIRNDIILPYENSPNHGGKGQAVLFTDGSALWLPTPELDNGDNIWLPKGLEAVLDMIAGRELRLEGTEFPSGAADAFLGP